jgi:hypothetical protein
MMSTSLPDVRRAATSHSHTRHGAGSPLHTDPLGPPKGGTMAERLAQAEHALAEGESFGAMLRGQLSQARRRPPPVVEPHACRGRPQLMGCVPRCCASATTGNSS